MVTILSSCPRNRQQASPPLSLYGSSLLIVIAFVTRFLPIAFLSCASGVRSLNPELEEAVRIHGGSRLRALSDVVAPVLKKSLGRTARCGYPCGRRT
ncbi:hypothetical protein [Chachezhania antarctica]|uniref:hypothetical protein n=1 Tax=Chachezhania antarctica TaxID=2340860 RepID=UPI0013CF3E12|nr:hypothetical protein [Chachezhania antarctica]|tara:strand:+ start:4993 stop:5283 length:291 start_codon:yes stop_codon:yes gene_type:complete